MAVGTNYFTTLSTTVDCALTDKVGNAVLITCTVANLPTGAGFRIGCIAITEAGIPYCNTGTAAIASFVKVSAT